MSVRILAVIGVTAGVLFAGSASAQDEICNTVINGFDQDAISQSGRQVLHKGSAPCPQEAVIPEPEPEPEPIIIAGDVAFEFDSATIRPSFYPTLDEIAAALKQDPSAQLQVIGHTDSVGAETYNQGLSERRAQAVAEYLASQGVSVGRMQVGGMGESQPIATNDTQDGRAQNRRVEISTS